ncbi:MAG: hypothetical protein H7A23_17345 [Leptospiraceae bacterium]|nr:hypothetical protein [Leptospiraceae bacterium]MCP5496314.1 hypothetical protein [Leptospiraceae bacterium]
MILGLYLNELKKKYVTIVILHFCLHCSLFTTLQSPQKKQHFDYTQCPKNAQCSREKKLAFYMLPKMSSNLSKQESQAITEAFFYIFNLKKKSLVLPLKTYQQKSRFEKYFGFPFEGFQLGIWLINRIHSLKKGDTGFYTAINHDKHLILGTSFFQLSVLDRAIALLHEAKHSEGSKFSHIRCPNDFHFLSHRNLEANLANTLSCDSRPDGAYGITATFLFEMIAYNLENRELLVGKYNSELARIIAKQPSCFFNL